MDIDEEIKQVIISGCEKAHKQFENEMLAKRDKFYEKVHAAFVLNTNLTKFGTLTKEDLGWLSSAYPNSIIQTGSDQGAAYYTITPIL